ncbi:hypothetical protein EHS25_002429 [Saitozyma podzolica]|uniref:Uncharacterized protein n=1 Tax=Saitozyma podzolica TaxID=1890683 RepID=A0A427YED2_9TREE|nr:hypothetical protein EHS25_002429 [Saitozyma podzolica]
MSSNNNGSGFGTAATYQSIIIALVAGGILATGIVSIIWRRRRYREIERALHDATIRGTRTRRKGGKEPGKMPGIWDVVVGQGGEEIEGEGGRGKRIEEQERHGRNGARREEGEPEPDASGAMAEGWNPTSIALVSQPRTTTEPYPESANQLDPTTLEIVVLIAMPSPDRPLISRASSSSSSSSTSYPRKPTHLVDYPVLYTTPSEADWFPPLELASARIPLPIRDAQEGREVERLMRLATERRAAPSRPPSPSMRVER